MGRLSGPHRGASRVAIRNPNRNPIAFYRTVPYLTVPYLTVPIIKNIHAHLTARVHTLPPAPVEA